jgi:hypothetical protein
MTNYRVHQVVNIVCVRRAHFCSVNAVDLPSEGARNLVWDIYLL